MDELDQMMLDAGIGVDLKLVEVLWKKRVAKVLEEAMLTQPETKWMQKGGKQGKHTEQMGFILTEMQWMQRAYPGLDW